VAAAACCSVPRVFSEVGRRELSHPPACCPQVKDSAVTLEVQYVGALALAASLLASTAVRWPAALRLLLRGSCSLPATAPRLSYKVTARPCSWPTARWQLHAPSLLHSRWRGRPALLRGCLPAWLHLAGYLCVWPSVYLSTCLFTCLSGASLPHARCFVRLLRPAISPCRSSRLTSLSVPLSAPDAVAVACR
jgi:hypothetical protein